MLLKKIALSVSILTLSTATLADVPKVVTDIAPVHSLVAQVMRGIGEPALLIKPENSPHEYNLRPSEARALSKADIVFWIGEDLTPWLDKSLDSLAGSAEIVSLMDSSGTQLLSFREGATFEAHDHNHDDHEHKHDEHDHDDHDHDHDAHEHEHDEHEHDDHDHDAHEHEHDEHDEHDHDHDAHEHEHDEHDHGGHAHSHDGDDPHVWLDPVNAQAWLQHIATTLAEQDPANAERYRRNAEQASNELDRLITELQAEADALGDVKFIVFHDAYQYFETRFDVLASGALSVSDASDPSPARVAEIRQTVNDLNVSCIFTEPQFNPNLVKTVFDGTDVYTGIMDPLGVDIEPGVNQYQTLILRLMQSLSNCAS
ncbi:zinc ABC transporter substrate-binding protein [Reinekea blandensis]|uniref:High-affinity zinc uptake system protein ZnuA n=1 Tax=Reinekea blandensis MED297 TaxID=314283 RepID=A4BAY1_9GAMM|nr:zinc ABC transporter substrate-binding protein [Reinekea blandensis]EAR10594.1 ABC-type Zn2+ transport system, periplasmic component/surface adhesin [Reinekea sp. MED297] [Reinekea blandensis MED297]